MPAPLSLDLRQRIITAYDADTGATMEQVAARFDVGVATVNRLLRRRRETGSIHPSPRRGHPPRRIDTDGEQLLRSLVEEQPDLYVHELAELFTQRTGISVSQPTVSRSLKRMVITRKKSR